MSRTLNLVCSYENGAMRTFFLETVQEREESGLCPPAAVQTVLETQSEVSTQGLSLQNTPQTNKPSLMKDRPSGLKHSPAGQNPDDRKTVMRVVVV